MDCGLNSGSSGESSLLKAVSKAAAVIELYRGRARLYFYEVVLSGFSCHSCDGSLVMQSEGMCACRNGHCLDPTAVFQRSPCCGVRLVKRRLHYVCRRCGADCKSRFLFDERVRDADYFRERMREGRQRKKDRYRAGAAARQNSLNR